MSTRFGSLRGRPVSVSAGKRLLTLFWPEFKEINDCIYLEFQSRGGPINELSEGKTETECFVNHTHILDEFKNGATTEKREHVEKDFDVVENFYDETHPDFIAACEIGVKIAQMWCLKLRLDFPSDRFRVYYTQYDNPTVRFHKVRTSEALWFTDDAVRNGTAPNLRAMVVYDTDHPSAPVTNGARQQQ